MIESIRSKSNVVIATILLATLAAFIYINIPFLLPFILAGIFAMGVNDFTERSARRLRIHRGWMIAIVTILGFAIFWIPLTLAIRSEEHTSELQSH